MFQSQLIVLFAILFAAHSATSPQDTCLSPPSESDFISGILGTSQSLLDLIMSNSNSQTADYSTLRFVYYTPDHSTYITADNASSVYDSSKPTKVLVHGWQANITLYWVQTLAKLYAQQGNNVILLDWSQIASGNYLQGCIFPVPKVGKLLAEFLAALYNKNLASSDSVEVIGHSCGAQVAGACGRGVSVGKIAGLDAAGPCYSTAALAAFCPALSAKDAKFVQGFTTNPGFFGNPNTYGHLDTHFNGICQPNCVDDANFLKSSRCSHFQACYLWIDSISNAEKYVTIAKCDSGEGTPFKNCKESEGVQVGATASESSQGNYLANTTTAETVNNT